MFIIHNLIIKYGINNKIYIKNNNKIKMINKFVYIIK